MCHKILALYRWFRLSATKAINDCYNQKPSQRDANNTKQRLTNSIYDIIIILSYQLSLVVQESWINTCMHYCHEKILCLCKINISAIAINYHKHVYFFRTANQIYMSISQILQTCVWKIKINWVPSDCFAYLSRCRWKPG